MLHLDLKGSFVEKGLPGALCGLTALQYLDMSEYHTEILEQDDLPNVVGNLTNIKVLNLSYSLNELIGIGNDDYLDFIGTLTDLEHLDLCWNPTLEYLPKSIGNLKRLHTLNLENCNDLESLPEEYRWCNWAEVCTA